MDLKALMHADYLDVIFYNRNKSYGGYLLRKYYGNRMGKAVAILYSTLAVLVLIAVLQKSPLHHDQHTVMTTICPTLIEPDIKIAPPVKPKLPDPPPAAKANTKMFTPPIVTKDPIPDEKELPKIETLKDANPGTSNTNDTAGFDSDDNNPGRGTITMPAEAMPDKPRTFVSQMPTFNGDITAYLSSHVRYPEEARNAGIEGRVAIEFVVNEDGSVTNTHVSRGIGGGCDEEALRVVASMPKWNAGKHNGLPVKVYFKLAVKFELQ